MSNMNLQLTLRSFKSDLDLVCDSIFNYCNVTSVSDQFRQATCAKLNLLFEPNELRFTALDYTFSQKLGEWINSSTSGAHEVKVY